MARYKKSTDDLKEILRGTHPDKAARFLHEEQEVFPHIGALLAGKRDTTYSISEFIQTHSDIEGKLDDLLNIVFKYLPPQVDDDNVLDVVYDILRLSEDLKKHTFIEEKIMVPLVRHLENAVLS